MGETVQHGGYGLYVKTWVWLLVITLVEVGITFLPLSRATLVSLLVLLAIMKVVLIAAYFMHLRFERLSLVYMVLMPIILIVALIAGIWPDALTLAR